MLINIHNKVNCSAILLSAYSYISKIQRNLNTFPVTSSRGHVLRLQRGDRSFLPVTIDNQAPSDIMVSKIDHIFCLLLYLLFYFVLRFLSLQRNRTCNFLKFRETPTIELNLYSPCMLSSKPFIQVVYFIY